MRKLRRSVARARMEAKGITRINKPRRGLKGEPLPSFFAENWRKYSTI